MIDLVLTVARAICRSRTCEGVSCCQWPAQRGRTECPVNNGGYTDAAREAISAVDAWRAAHSAPAWDMFSNRCYPPVEKRAAEIYAAMEYEGPGSKPEWMPGGNSQKQDQARYLARRELLAAGHEPDSSGDRK